MEINEKLLKQVTETKYLTVENAWRYRAIIRYFYLQAQKMKYWIYKEEVFEELKKHDIFKDYTIEQCRQDLDALVEWKNLNAVQDTSKASTIEEFKNKQFRYQITDYTVEIERMILKLENWKIEGASLEPSLLERFKKEIEKFKDMKNRDMKEAGSWWMSLNEDFKRLNQNYQDYIRHLNSVKAEKMMKTQQFLIFKDKFIEYLRNFVKELQQNSYAIEYIIKDVDEDTEKIVLDKVIEYSKSIPRLDMEISEKDIKENILGRWLSIKEWFLGSNFQESETSKLFGITNQIIRKITRYAFQIVESRNTAANRKEEYKKLCSIFLQAKDMEEAHMISAYAFGIPHMKHIRIDMHRETESINSGVYDEKPYEVAIKPRVRTYREKRDRTPIKDNTEKKKKILKETIEKRNQERKIIEGYIIDNQIEISKLPKIEPYVRTTLLKWISRANSSPDGKAKTEDGRVFKLIKPKNNERCILDCEDGQLEMPSYILKFE
ncbi:TIGR02677 family protein [Caloranaerobacter sp. DY30410]|uniref:TIGR02677 family protein n=1 Tax=Caloranaerobacter sp. DY30410 TaxID=3238305 RepID=UPI003D01A6BC